MADGLTISALAKRLGITYQAVYKRVQSGDINGEKTGRFWLIPGEEVARLLATETAASKPDTTEIEGVQQQVHFLERENKILAEGVTFLKERVVSLDMQLERQTILLGSAQQQLMRPLPKGLNWIDRLFRRQHQQIDVTDAVR
ncbi:hypothetical protein CMK11_07175 [Candidatus Poribacteria bacterium]|jgi:excisionase family DNA binding protein|nr:hypothetical protein [Candidatus Poribacteria bacterium]